VAFLGIGWFTAFRWKWKAILFAPVLTVLIGSGLSTLYIRYDEWLAKQALHTFIMTTTNAKLSSKFSVSNEIWQELQADVSQNYAIEYYDNFFGSHEWIIRFTNGSAYFLSFQQTGLGHWSVSIEHSK
jgi:hypothetical protein